MTHDASALRTTSFHSVLSNAFSLACFSEYPASDRSFVIFLSHVVLWPPLIFFVVLWDSWSPVDHRLYEYVYGKFHERINALGEDFQDEVASFKKKINQPSLHSAQSGVQF
jgi:hypothetical protein